MDTYSNLGGHGHPLSRVFTLFSSVHRGSQLRLNWEDWPYPGLIERADLLPEVPELSPVSLFEFSSTWSDVRKCVSASGGDPSLFRELYQLGSLFSKYPFEIPGIDREKAAMDKLGESEDHCDVVNARLYASDSKASFPWERQMLRRMRAFVHRVLGDFEVAEVFTYAGFGPGASTSLPRRKGDAFYKFGNPTPNVTENALPCIALLDHYCPLWGRFLKERSKPSIVVGNRVTTVPKNSRTDRCIAIEPDLNQFLQKGIGAMIRRRLRVAGCDLNSQEHNQRLAFLGSLTRELATLDLASASDSVSTELVRYLLPDTWFSWCSALRSPRGFTSDGDLVSWSKFSSMGNGYTFELESLIFWALVNVVAANCGGKGTHRAVYGDDIIVAEALVEPCVRLLDFVGFRVNEEKSFHGSTPFRESCGSHFFDGCDVTPIYVRKPLDSLPSLVALHNNFILRGMKNYDGEFRCPFWGASAKLAEGWVPRRFRVNVPLQDGNTGLWKAFDEASPKLARAERKRGFEGYTIKRISVRTPLTPAEGEPAVLKALYGMEKLQFRDLVEDDMLSSQLRSKDEASFCYTLSKGVVGHWCDLPPLFDVSYGAQCNSWNPTQFALE